MSLGGAATIPASMNFFGKPLPTGPNIDGRCLNGVIDRMSALLRSRAVLWLLVLGYCVAVWALIGWGMTGLAQP